jgi:hypothetical protein
MNKTERSLIERMRDTLNETIDLHIYGDDDPRPTDCRYAALIREATAALEVPAPDEPPPPMAHYALQMRNALQWLLDDMRDAGETHSADGVIFDSVENAARSLVAAGGFLRWYPPATVLVAPANAADLLAAAAEYVERFADLSNEPSGGDCRNLLVLIQAATGATNTPTESPRSTADSPQEDALPTVESEQAKLDEQVAASLKVYARRGEFDGTFEAARECLLKAEYEWSPRLAFSINRVLRSMPERPQAS